MVLLGTPAAAAASVLAFVRARDGFARAALGVAAIEVLLVLAMFAMMLAGHF